VTKNGPTDHFKNPSKTNSPFSASAPNNAHIGSSLPRAFPSRGQLSLSLVADCSNNHRIRVLRADLQQVSTVTGDGERAHREANSSLILSSANRKPVHHKKSEV